jgi:hypothetical protein
MRNALCLALLIAAAPLPAALPAVPTATIVHDRAALARLRANSGLALQWVSWDRRGRLAVTAQGGLYHLRGTQAGRGRLELDGDVLEIGATSFAFRGRIAIVDAPDPGRNCIRDGTYEFRITRNRHYWRLQQMEACDGLTDYVDIYF